MKLHRSKKIKKQFDPIGHWHMMLLAISILLLVVAAYGTYCFFFIKNQIVQIDVESKNLAQEYSSPDLIEKSKNTSQFMQDIDNLNKVLGEFVRKEKEYDRLIKTAVLAPVLSTTTASTTVATSTN